MQEINLKTLNLKKLNQIQDKQNREGSIYHDEKIAFKIYDKLISSEKERKNIILNELSSIYPIEHVVWPMDKIVSITRKSLFHKEIIQTEGNTMKYIPDATQLFDFKEVSLDGKIFSDIVISSSKTLEEIHKNGIFVPDLSFSNIIFDKNFEHYFVDFDSVSFGKNNGVLSGMLRWYFRYKGIDLEVKPNVNCDKISLILHFLYVILDKSILSVNNKEYDRISEQIEVLKDLKEVVLEIKKKENVIPTVPYLHEIIKENNNFSLKVEKNSCHNKKNIIY